MSINSIPLAAVDLLLAFCNTIFVPLIQAISDADQHLSEQLLDLLLALCQQETSPACQEPQEWYKDLLKWLLRLVEPSSTKLADPDSLKTRKVIQSKATSILACHAITW